MKRIMALAATLLAVVGCSNPVAPAASAKAKASLDNASMSKGTTDGKLAAN